MTKLRKGDTVLLRATVTDVAPYDDKQQIMVRLEPNGSRALGWLVPQEYDFRLDKALIRPDDRVWVDRAQSLIGTVIAIAPAVGCNPAFAWIKPDGRNDFRSTPVGELERA